MKNKFKLLSDYQYVSSDKRIFLIKAGTIIEDYTFKTKGVDIKIDKEIVDVNPQLFQLLDWKTELLSHLKVSKIPQPAQVSKKLIPFIEDIILSTTSSSDNSDDKYNEIIELENSIKRRESRLNDNEDDINIRLKILEKREMTIKSELIDFDKRERDIRLKLSNIKDLENILAEKENELNKKERDVEFKVLESSTDIESKYSDIQTKINIDIENINRREIDIDSRAKEVTKLENILADKEAMLLDKERDITIKEEEMFVYGEEVNRINSEIEEWEELHWKFKRMGRKPPSCE